MGQSNGAAFSFDVETAVRHLRNTDRSLDRHISRCGAFLLELEPAENVFGALAEAIIHQQLSGKAAATIHGRVAALMPRRRVSAAGILAADDESLRAAGLSRAKLASLRDLAANARKGRIPTARALAQMDDDAIIDALTAVRGIGRWTVEMLLIFRLGRPDVLPITDLSIRKGFARVFRGHGEFADPAAIVRRAERWRPYRTVASWYLWRACD